MRCYNYYCYITITTLSLLLPIESYYYQYHTTAIITTTTTITTYLSQNYYYSPTTIKTIITVVNLKLSTHVCVHRLEDVLCSKRYISVSRVARLSGMCVVFFHHKNQYLLARLIMCCIYVNYYVICMRVTLQKITRIFDR